MQKIYFDRQKGLKRIFSGIFVSVLCLGCGVVFASSGIRLYEKIKMGPENDLWIAKEEYPFETNMQKKEDFLHADKQSIKQLIVRLETKVDAQVTNNFRYKMPLVLLQKKFDHAIWKYNMTTSLNDTSNDPSSSEDVVVQLDNGYLSFVIDDFDTNDTVDKLVDFAHQMESEGRNFLWLETPIKTNGNDFSEYDDVITDYSIEKRKEIFEAFDRNGLHYKSLTEEMDALPSDKSELFFRTDHHWLPQTGLWACSVLAEELNHAFGYDIDADIYDISYYTIEYADREWLGSQGKKVTAVYTNPERFPIVMPKYATDLSVFISKLNCVKNGKIQDTLFDFEMLNETDLYKGNYYMSYGYGDQPYVSIHNHDKNDRSRMLVVKQSFADTMYPYMCHMAEYIDVIDLRYFDGSVQTLIQKTNPDTVIVVYGMHSFEETADAFDFR